MTRAKQPSTDPSRAAAKREASAGKPSAAEYGQDAFEILRASGPVAIGFLLAYLIVYDYHFRQPLLIYHWIALAATSLFFGLAWMPNFRRYWKLWTLLFCTLVIALFVGMGTKNGDLESPFIAILLCSVATACFVRWSTRWQVAMNAICFVGFLAAGSMLPRLDPYWGYRWIGLLAAMTLAQYTAFFLSSYERKVRQQMQVLEEAARFRERQIATMTHDIRNPVAALAGLAGLLQDGGDEKSTPEGLVARIGSAARGLDLLVANLLDLYALEKGGIQPIRRRVEVNAVVSETVSESAAAAAMKGLKLELELGSPVTAEIDPLHLERILRNLVDNAIRRTAGGVIRVSSAERGASFILEVSDDGPPVDPSELSDLFRPPMTERGDDSRAGLGRYIARSLVEANGGALEVRPGTERGLSVIVTLPLRPGAEAERPHHPKQP